MTWTNKRGGEQPAAPRRTRPPAGTETLAVTDSGDGMTDFHYFKDGHLVNAFEPDATEREPSTREALIPIYWTTPCARHPPHWQLERSRSLRPKSRCA